MWLNDVWDKFIGDVYKISYVVYTNNIPHKMQ